MMAAPRNAAPTTALEAKKVPALDVDEDSTDPVLAAAAVPLALPRNAPRAEVASLTADERVGFASFMDAS